jgi:aryl-alcohol dehydrogenase-like predicted oxidoreductase
MSLAAGYPENEALIHSAIGAGINFFDTADIYQEGQNEICLGKAIRGKRDRIILATKAGNVPLPGGKGLAWDASKKHILKAAEDSLKRLQTDYIDLFQLHGGTIDDPLDETIEAFEKLRTEGKIRYYGISSIRPNVIRAYLEKSAITSVMMQYGLLDRRPEESCIGLLKERHIGLIARGSLARGLLVDKVPVAFLNFSEGQVSITRDAIHALSGSLRSPAQTAIRFVLKEAAVSVALVGIRNRKQLEDAIGVSASPGLTDKECMDLRNIVEAARYELHR